MITAPGATSEPSARPRPVRARRVATFVAACSTLLAVAAPAADAAATRTAPRCPQLRGKIVCVDQNHQTLWVQQGGKTIFSPVRVRTGMPGRRTPDGLFHIWLRNRHQYSHLFNEPMPYSLFFHGDYALHGTYQNVRKGGSNGCVNLTVADAAKLFGMLGRGDAVYVWGHKPH